MMTEEAVKISDAELELQLPKPVGYRVLVALPQPEQLKPKIISCLS
mgnify:CR=1 FL=1